MAHFYALKDEEVHPRHFVEMTSRPGELRPTRITDVKRWWREGEVVVPSVTTVLGVLNKHALNNWKIDQHLQQAWNLNPSEFSSQEAYLSEVKRLTEMEMDKAPTAGTDFHDSLEKFLLGDLPHDHDDYEACTGAFEAVAQGTGLTSDDWIAEAPFVCGAGFGGKCDLHSEHGWVIDYKTKREAAKFKPGKMVYDEHRMQAAAYREGLGLPNARCANVFVCLETGEIDFHEHTAEELAHGWRLFSHALEIWKLQNGFPEPMQEAA